MFTKILTKLGYTKEETSWVLYDIGNSAQVLTTMTVLFPLLIASITPVTARFMSAGQMLPML